MNNLQNAIAVVTHAEGHHSGALDVQIVFIPMILADKVAEILTGYGYGIDELDGKHSYTEAKVSCLHNISDILETFECETGSECFAENFILNLPLDIREQVFTFDEEIKANLTYESVTTTEYMYNGEKIS